MLKFKRNSLLVFSLAAILFTLGCNSTRVIPDEPNSSDTPTSNSSSDVQNFLKEIEDFAQSNGATTRNRSDSELAKAGKDICKNQIPNYGITRAYSAIDKMKEVDEMSDTQAKVLKNSFKVAVKYFCPKYNSELGDLD